MTGTPLTGVRFQRPGGSALGSVAVATGESYLGQAGGASALVAVPGPGGAQRTTQTAGSRTT